MSKKSDAKALRAASIRLMLNLDKNVDMLTNEFENALKTRDNTMLQTGASVVRAAARANMSKDSYYSRKYNNNNNSSQVTIKNISHLEEEELLNTDDYKSAYDEDDIYDN